MRTREKPVVDVDLSTEPTPRAVTIIDKKKVSTPRPQKKRASAGANNTKNATIIITDESKSTTDSASANSNRDLMKFITESKKVTMIGIESRWNQRMNLKAFASMKSRVCRKQLRKMSKLIK